MTRSRTISPVLMLGLALAAVSCRDLDIFSSGSEIDDGTGSAQIALMQVPSDVQCVIILAQGSRAVQQTYDVTPGQSSVLTITGLPSGQVTFSGQAFSGACAGVTSMTVADYIADPVTVQIAPPAVASVSLFMHRNGRASVGVDWEGDGGVPDAGRGGTGGGAGAGTGGAAGAGTGGAADAGTVSLVVSTTALMVPEGASATFTVRLSGDPGAPVSINVSSANPSKVTAGPAVLMFNSANFAAPQTVMLTAQQDVDVATDVVPVTLLAPPPIAPVTVTVTDTDDDVQAIQLNPPGPIAMSESTTSPPAVTSTFGVRLAFQPATTVSVMIVSSNITKLTVAPATLTFSPGNFSTVQNVILTSVHDTDTANDTVTVTSSSAGIPTVPFTVNITDTGP